MATDSLPGLRVGSFSRNQNPAVSERVFNSTIMEEQLASVCCIICLRSSSNSGRGCAACQSGNFCACSCTENSQDKLRQLIESLEIFMESELSIDKGTTYHICDNCEVVVERLHELRLKIERYLQIMKGVQLKLFSLIVESGDGHSSKGNDVFSTGSVPRAYKNFRSKIIKRFRVSVPISNSERRLANSYIKALLPDTSNTCRRLKSEFQEKFSNWLNFSDRPGYVMKKSTIAPISSNRLVPGVCKPVKLDTVIPTKILSSAITDNVDATASVINNVLLDTGERIPFDASDKSIPSHVTVTVFEEADVDDVYMEIRSNGQEDPIGISGMDNVEHIPTSNDDLQSETLDDSYHDALEMPQDDFQEEFPENTDEKNQAMVNMDVNGETEGGGKPDDIDSEPELVDNQDEPTGDPSGVDSDDTSDEDFDQDGSSQEDWVGSTKSATPPPRRSSKRKARKDGLGYKAIENDMLKCNDCDETFFTVTAVKRHIHVFHNEHRQSTIRGTSPCRAIFGENEFTYGNFKFRKYANNIYKCPVCRSQSLEPQNLISHARRKHRDILQTVGIAEKMIEPAEGDTVRIPKPKVKNQPFQPVHVEVEPNKFIYKNKITYEFDGEQYSCTYCGFRKTENLTKMKDHVREHIYRGTRLERKQRKTDKVHRFYPKLYGSDHIDYSGFKIQIIGDHYSCSECSMKLASKYKMFEHVRRIHLFKEEYRCETCGREFKRYDLLRSHRKIHERSPLLCSLCGKVFKQELVLRQHEKSHASKIQGFPCAYCPKVCETQHKYRWHKKKYHREFIHRKVSKKKHSTSSSAGPPTATVADNEVEHKVHLDSVKEEYAAESATQMIS